MKNNFDLLRLIFAVFVVITHSYILSGNPNDFFWQMTKQTTLSYIGVAGFFVISGYLIFKSFERSKNISDFFEKRIRRIFPGLIIAQLVTLIAISILIKEEIFFLFQKETILYFVKGCTIFLQKFRISGLFENNLHPQVINGSLWTIPFEFFLYIFMAVFFTIFKFKDNLFSILLLLVILLSNFLFYDRNILQGILPESLNYNLKNLAHFGVFFFSGVLFAKYQIY
jgi:peptidoglycan/LPS O-acetylase OafA/YrhL